MDWQAWLGTAWPRGWEIIGSGGKTTFMSGLAAQLGAEGKNVIYTTSTHLAAASPLYPGRIVEGEDLERARQEWIASPQPRLWGLRRLSPQGKWLGYSPQELEEIAAWPGLDHLLVEADGSRGLPLKAHAMYEPVLYPSAQLGVAVLGLSGLGRAVVEGEVHRPQLLERLLGCEPGAIIGCRELVTIAWSYLNELDTPYKLLVLSQAQSWEMEYLYHLAKLIVEAEPPAQHLAIMAQSPGEWRPLWP